MVERSRRRAVR